MSADSDDHVGAAMRVLITGGAGFIGSHLAEALLGRGHRVTLLDDLSTGRIENLATVAGHPRLECVFDTVTEPQVVTPLVAGADIVFHLAAAVGVRLVVNHPLRTIRTNVDGTDVVLDAALTRRTRVVIASTSEVYGKSTALPFRENGDLVLGPSHRARWGYATSKLLDEFLALAYWKEHHLPVTIVRLFNTVGPRQNNRYGMVLPTFVHQALAGEPLLVHGDGSQQRCFTWVGDVVSALMQLSTEPSAIGEVFNVGSDEEISILQLARDVKAMTGSESDIRLVPYGDVFSDDFEDMPRRVPDLTKIRRSIGYEPTLTLDRIVERTIDYWRGGEVVRAAA